MENIEKQTFKVSEKMMDRMRDAYYKATEEERRTMIHPDDASGDPYLFAMDKLSVICISVCDKNVKQAAEKFLLTRDLVLNGHNPFKDTTVAKCGIDVQLWKAAIKVIRGKEEKKPKR